MSIPRYGKMGLAMLLLTAALIFLGTYANDLYEVDAEVDALHVEDAKVTKYSTGPFNIVYDPQGDSLIEIYDGTSLVWFTSSSEKDKIFAGAATITETVEQNGGVFVIDDKVTETCDEMDITDYGSKSGSGGHNVVYFNGTICSSTTFSLTFQADSVSDGNQMWSHLQLNFSISENSPYNQLWLSYGCAEDEHFYGFGAQYSKFDMKGHRLPLFLSEQGVGRGLEPLTRILDEVSKGSGTVLLTSEINLFIFLFRRNLVHHLYTCSILPDQLPQRISTTVPSIFSV